MDIVEQLRDLGDRAAFEPHMHHKAADEIERLRGGLKRRPIVYCFTEESSTALLKSNEKDAEIERLRQQNAELGDIIQTICDKTGMCVSNETVLFQPQSKWYLTTGGE